MRALFKSFYQPSAKEFADLWENALICLDANVLLNLYRFPSEARDEFLDFLDKLGGRVWVPYHAALEFHRNRPKVIADQRKKFGEVRTIVNTSLNKMRSDISALKLNERHSSIKADEFIDSNIALSATFIQQIDALESDHVDITGPDPILDKIEAIFTGRVGPAPSSEDLESIQKWANERFEAKIPPGYLDAKKDASDGASFSFGGCQYQSKYGDAIIWWQILSHCRSEGVESLIFVTDDVKEDWWNVVTSGGQKVLGPRPELADELSREAGVETFYMYRTSRFLIQAKSALPVNVSQETISRVEDIETVSEAGSSTIPSMLFDRRVHAFLTDLYPSYKIEHDIFPDFIIKSLVDNHSFGVEVLRANSARGIETKILSRSSMVRKETASLGLSHIDIFICSESRDTLDRVLEIEAEPDDGYINLVPIIELTSRDGSVTLQPYRW